MEHTWYKHEELDWRISSHTKDITSFKEELMHLEEQKRFIERKISRLYQHATSVHKGIKSLEKDKKYGRPDGWFSNPFDICRHKGPFAKEHWLFTSVDYMIILHKEHHSGKAIYVKKGHTDKELSRIDELFKKSGWFEVHMIIAEFKLGSIQKVYGPISSRRIPYIPEQIYCGICDKVGHKYFECPKARCKKCKKYGHIEKYCYLGKYRHY